MVIELRLHDLLKSYVPSSSSGIVTVDVIGDMTVNELLDELEIDKELVETVMVNSQKCGLSQLLYDGDKVSLFPKK